MFCIEHRPQLARWGVAVSVAATLMGSVLAVLNWLIVLPFSAPSAAPSEPVEALVRVHGVLGFPEVIAGEVEGPLEVHGSVVVSL